jgi:squalene-hopene/tetraprenyl-beta-curcumene cyclase
MVESEVVRGVGILVPADESPGELLMIGRRFTVFCCASMALIAAGSRGYAGGVPQYEFGDIKIPKAAADEPVRDRFSPAPAATYLDQGAKAWGSARKCISCHTTGTYMLIRPSLTPQLGRPPQEIRNQFVAALKDLAALSHEELHKGILPGQVIYAAAGLAEWDARVSKSLSPETRQALELMCAIQLPSGTWGSSDCWPPYESDAFHEATVAAIAVSDAPGWLANLNDPSLRAGVERLKHYLRTTPPPHDYGRTLLLWASDRMPDLLDKQQRQALVEMVWKHQQKDGGWSIRTFATPEAWGRGNRADKLRGEPEFAQPPSDGHQTGMAIVALREAGVPASDPRIQRGVAWLLRNQRASGRWWTRSLNTNGRHFITYSGTALPLLALSLCDALPVDTAKTER